MEWKEIVFVVVALSIAGVRLYQKYHKKNNPGSPAKQVTGSEFKTLQKEDDYEPYSGR